MAANISSGNGHRRDGMSRREKIKIPLRTVLLVPFIFQIVIITSLVGYLSYHNGQKAVNEVTNSLHYEINARINEYLEDFIETPLHIINNNAAVIRLGMLDSSDQAKMERYFWEQIQIYRSVSSIYFGNSSGGAAISGRDIITGSYNIMGTDGFTKGTLRKFSETNGGSRGKLLLSVPDFDSRTRPWFQAALSKGDSTWSDVYILFTGQDMTISASKPVYGRSHNLLGVVSVDLFLSHLSSYLAGIDIGKTGLSFIIDRDGLFIATSTGEMIFTPKTGGEIQRRLNSVESSTPVIRKASEELKKVFGSIDRIKSDSQLDFTLDGEKRFVHVSPIHDRYGLDWIIVSVIPESDFMGDIKANNRITIILVFAAVNISIIIGFFIARWIAGNVYRLKSAVSGMTDGLWPENPGTSNIAEIDDLKNSFFQMSRQLKELFGSLTMEIKERKLTEGALRESEEKYRELIRYSNSIILRIDNDGIISYVNEYALNFFGFSSEELVGKSIFGTIVPRVDSHGQNLEEMITKVINNPPLFERVENENIRKDGSRVWIVWANRGIIDNGGNRSGVLSIGTDITERRLAEVEVNKLLKEKEIMLHEVHHRIKNNMNTIAGLLYLQSMSVADEAGAAALKDAHNRVLGMMMIYDKLFRSPDFDCISTAAYLTELIEGIVSTLPGFGHIKIETRIDDFKLDSDTLVPVGIIINELLSNAYKYAFNGRTEGLVEISFLNTGGNSFVLLFRDNGIGLPDSFVPGESKGFGLNLVYLLTSQMHGTVEVVREGGATFKIRINY